MASNTTTQEESSSSPKCPCCNNPWAAATGDIFAKLCLECKEGKEEEEGKSESKPSSTSLRKYLDESVSPADDFYHYANGTWIKENQIPAGYPSWNTFLKLHTLSQERLKDLLVSTTEEEKAETKEGSESGSGSTEENLNAMKVKAFYSAAMDEDKIEQVGIDQLSGLLALCDKAASDKEALDEEGVASSLGQLLSQYGVSSFFSIGE